MKASADELSPPAEPSIRWHGIARSLLLHVCLILALLGLWRPDVPPETVPPLIRVVFGPPGAAGIAGGGGGETQGQGQTAPSDKDAAASGAAAPQQEADAASAQSQAETPAQDASPTPPTPIPSPAARTSAPVPTATPLPTAQPSNTAALAPPPPRPEHKPTPHHARLAAAVPPPQPRPPVATHAPPSPTPEAIAASAAAAPGSGNGAGTKSGEGQGTEGNAHGVVGDGPLEGPGDDYLEKLRRWLAKYKTYPQAALDKKEEGKVIVGFTLKRDGTVLDAWIERSSGMTLLDAAALAMMHRASPVPPVPERYKANQLTLAMPVDYTIGFFERLFR